VSIWTDLSGVPFRQGYCDANGIRTRLIEAGEGAPVILLHGTGGHAEAFTRNIAAHARHFHVIAMDMIGHGYTDGPDITYTMDTLVDHLGDTIDALGLRSVSLSGESLGALVATHYAIRRPERVTKLVLNTGMIARRSEADRAALRDVLERTQRATGQPTREAVKARLNWLMYEPGKSVTEELVDVRYAIYADPGRAKIIRRLTELIVGGLLDDAWSAKYSNPEDMRGVRAPTLVVWTRHNPSMDVASATKNMAYLPDARLVVFDQSAHWPQWEEPERYNEVQVEFLLER